MVGRSTSMTRQAVHTNKMGGDEIAESGSEGVPKEEGMNTHGVLINVKDTFLEKAHLISTC